MSNESIERTSESRVGWEDLEEWIRECVGAWEGPGLHPEGSGRGID